MIKNILNFSENKWYWLGLWVLSICFEVVALFYQYSLEYAPCVLYIHVRIWVLGIFVVSLLGSVFYKYWYTLLSANMIMTGVIVKFYQ